MGKSIVSWFLMAFVIFAALPLATADADFVFYTSTDDGVKHSNIFHVTQDLGIHTRIGNPADTPIWELAVGPNDSFYGIMRQTDELWQIRRSDAAVMSVVALDADIRINPGRGFAAHPNGTLYGIFSGNQLRTINATTGVTTFVATITGATLEAMDFAPDGTLYAAGDPTGHPSNRIYTVDIASGNASLIGTAGAGVVDIDTLTFAPDGYLYGVDTNTLEGSSLYRFDPSDASTTLMGSLVGGVNGIVAVPEPSSLSILALLTALLYRPQRRRFGQ
ncbi:MAG: hypothetical protein WD534_18650 [Phycisphaeraceae bacterium]